jgi:hypothetical protein
MGLRETGLGKKRVGKMELGKMGFSKTGGPLHDTHIVQQGYSNGGPRSAIQTAKTILADRDRFVCK